MGQFSGVADVKNIIRGLNEPNIITGGDLADRLYGNATLDTITGGAGNDYIEGKGSRDIITGGLGNDTLKGGEGWDDYIVATGDGNDIIFDSDGLNTINATFLTTATSGVFIKKGNDLIFSEGTVNLTGDADGDGNDAEDLATEMTGIQALTSAAARRAGMRSVIKNLTTSVTIKNYFTGGLFSISDVSSSSVVTQTIMTNFVDYNTGLKYFNQAATNASVVYGTKRVDIIFASTNGQTLKGGAGDDIYYIDAKTDVIIDDISGDNDKVVFDDNNGGANVFTYTKEGNNLRITFDDGSGGDIDASVIVKNYYARKGAQIEQAGYDADADVSSGVSYDTYALPPGLGFAIPDKVGAQTSTSNILRGSVANDVLELDAGGQTAYGYTGDDLYTVTAGKAVIVDSGSVMSDALNADHVATQNDGVYIKRGNDLIILDGGDAVTGYADADAAVADLPNLSASQRRTVVKNLLEMNDSITIRNHFSNGNIETIKALNNSEITDQTMMTELIDYSTGLKFFNQDANTKIVRGTAINDYIVASASNQKLYGGAGTDVYSIAGGLTNVEIYDISGTDIVYFTDADLRGAADSYAFEKIGNDLKVSITDAGEGDSSVIIKNYFLNSKYEVETMWGSISTSMHSPDNEQLKIYGEDSNNVLVGGGGNDTINGGSTYFNDYLKGKEGSDTYEFLSGDQNDQIEEVDALGAADVDKAVFLGADFSSASNSITMTRNGNDLWFYVDEGDGVTTNMYVDDYFAGGSSQIEVVEDANGNSLTLATGVMSANFAAALYGHSDTDVFNASACNTGIAMYGNAGVDNFVGSDQSDTIYGGDDIDTALAGDGDDIIYGEDGGDTLFGQDGNDTIYGGAGNDLIQGNAGNDVIAYDLDSADTGGADTISDFTIGEDVIRFTTSANDILGLAYRNHIAVRDTGAGLEIGYGWDEATQDYASTITFTAYDDASVSTANVIEFVTSDGTTALTAAEITTILADIAADGDAPGTLAAIHDDIDAGAGGNDGQLLVDTINAAW